jgi:hypothetical protein
VNATNAALLGTLIGAGVALAGSVLTNVVLWQTERSRQKKAKTATDLEKRRQYTAAAFSELFALNHAISWITWFAKYAPHEVNQQMRASFDAETHGTFPKLLAAMAMVASVTPDVHSEPNLYSELIKLQDEVFDAWDQVAKALRRKRGRNIDMEALRACLPRAEQLHKNLPTGLRRLMEMA